MNKIVSAVCLAAVLPLGACNKSEPTPTPTEPAQRPTPAPVTTTKDAPAPAKVDSAALWKRAKHIWLVPHPAEIQKALKDLGLSEDVSAQVIYKDINFAPMDGPRVGVNVGSVIADLVLTAGQSSAAQNAKRLKLIVAGLKELGMPQEHLSKVEKFSHSVESGTLSAPAMLAELDTLQTGLLDDVEKYSSKDAVVAVQAGAWVRAVNVVATGIAKSPKAAEGAHFFRQRDVVAYFVDYLGANKDKVDASPMLKKALPAMDLLKSVMSKNDLTAQDLSSVVTSTNNILGYF